MAKGKPPRAPQAAVNAPKSNMPLLLIAMGFLMVTVVLVLLQPRDAGTPVANTEQNDTVTRSQVPLLDAPLDAPLEPEISARQIAQQLRQPIRLTGDTPPQLDLPGLTDAVLAQFVPPGSDLTLGKVLSNMVVESLLQRQSDTYIRVLLNTAAARGTITVPPALRTAAGDVDVPPLLLALVDAAGGETPAPILPASAGQEHVVTASDSLAGLALRHYGNPVSYTRILDANPALDPSDPQLEPGLTLTLP